MPLLVTGATGTVGSLLIDELREALEGCETAYYLIHSMSGRGGGFAARDREAAVNFGEAARAAGTRRVIYLGGLEPAGPDASERDLVRKLPLMVTPHWVDTRTQPVAITDVVRALAVLAEREDVPDEVQLGGADVLSYREMMRRTARALGRRPPASTTTHSDSTTPYAARCDEAPEPA